MNAKEQILKLHTEMREEILEAGIQDVHYDHVIKKLEKGTVDEHFELLGFFQLLRNKYYADLLVVRNYRPKEFWHNIKYLFSQHKLREQKLLRSEQRKLRQAWKGYFGEHTQSENEAVEDGSQKGVA